MVSSFLRLFLPVKYLPYLLFVLLFSVNANAAVLDWDVETWVPFGRSNLSESFVIDGTATGGPQDVTVTWTGNTAFLGDAIAPGLTDDSLGINQQNIGGLGPVENGLFLHSVYPDTSNPEHTIIPVFSYSISKKCAISFTFIDLKSNYINELIDSLFPHIQQRCMHNQRQLFCLNQNNAVKFRK